LGRSHPKATSPSLSLSPAFFPAHTLPNPSPPRALGAPAPGRYRAPCPLCYVARLDPSLSLLPFFSRVPERVSPFLPRGAALSSPDHHRARHCHITVSRPNSPPHLRPVVVGQTCLPFFPRMGTRQLPSSSLAAMPCLAASLVSCPRAASSFSRDVDARAPQPQPEPSRPGLVRHLLPSVPEPVVPIELHVAGTAQRRASAQSWSSPCVVRSTGDGPLRLPIRATSTSATTSTPGSSSPTYSTVFPAPRSVCRR
jgi:hypothetical protein